MKYVNSIRAFSLNRLVRKLDNTYHTITSFATECPETSTIKSGPLLSLNPDICVSSTALNTQVNIHPMFRIWYNFWVKKPEVTILLSQWIHSNWIQCLHILKKGANLFFHFCNQLWPPHLNHPHHCHQTMMDPYLRCPWKFWNQEEIYHTWG